MRAIPGVGYGSMTFRGDMTNIYIYIYTLSIYLSLIQLLILSPNLADAQEASFIVTKNLFALYKVAVSWVYCGTLKLEINRGAIC